MIGKSLWLSIGVFLIAATLSAQQPQHCAFEHRHAQSWTPEAQQTIEHIITQALSTLRPRSSVILPVVFHVVYHDPHENISDLQIRTQIDILNRDFAFMSENAFKVPDEFHALGSDTGLRFCLATTDPQGQPSTGITRTQTQIPAIGSHRQANGRYSVHYDIHGGRNGWDPEHYINIWVAALEGVLGSATFPGMAPHPEEDGVIIDPHFVGALGLAAQSAPFDRGHTLTHELGHYFGLLHIWGPGIGGCANDDLVDDTPQQATFYTGCPTYPQVSCGSSDMFMNFMDFTNDRCLALFTHGQAARMQAALTGLRASLLDNAVMCSPPDTGTLALDEMQIFYAPGDRRIVLALEVSSDVLRTVRVFSIDGRLVGNGIWESGATFWIDAYTWPIGIYIVQVETHNDMVAKKLFVY